MNKDHFEVRSAGYDETDYRLRYVDEMAEVIRKHLPLSPAMHLLDFGAGTGLLTERIAPEVSEITAVDISPSMISQLQEKSHLLPCRLSLLQQDLCRDELPEIRVDGIVSTMTLHHIEDVPVLFRHLLTLLKPGGFAAFCDIDTEDGSFHTLDTGVKHLGFDREEIVQWLKEAGFENVEIRDATVIRKPQGDYSAFLLSGYRPQS
ncbi:class I SAM-dependent methyltransferase [Nitratifractor sp.]|uniref:class I SAM-dependent DNA methyltransferase n=1 Tax=Nitratifractor sp. TaxID=2268144 RepID=UPI0025E05CC0|nr:class I SAM-dependent methyltransferase [Nitratifractor sp.]